MLKLEDIIKVENIIRIPPEEQLSSALSKLRTSHDAAFVFTHEGKFMGLINPYYCVIKSSYPGNAKVEHCLHHPPKVRAFYPLSKVASLFIESKVHYLPVFDREDRFLGIISARHILGEFRNSPLFKMPIKDVLRTKNRALITAYEDDTINTAVNSFRNTKVSKLVIIGKDLKLKGVLSHYDLISYLVSPKYSEHRGDRVGNTINFYHLKVKNFYKSYALTLRPENLMSEALNLILDRKIGSVIIVDKLRHPVGLVTTKDFLRLLIRGEHGSRMQFISKNLSEKSRQIVGGFFNQIYHWIRKIPDLASAKLFVKEEKRGGLFKVVLALIPKKGPPQVIKKEGKNLLKVLRKVKKD